jgi:hypothetical protein
MATELNVKELWVGWTRDAARQYERPDDLDEEDVVSDMVDFTTEYADMMLEEYEGFTASGRNARKKKKRKKVEEPDDDEEDEDDED